MQASGDEPTGTQLGEGRESRVDLGLGTGLQDMELHPLRPRRFLDASYHILGIGRFGFTNRAITLAWGTSWESRSSRLGFSSGDMMLMPVRLPPGRARPATRPNATRLPPPKKTIGTVEVAFFAACIPGVLLVTITSTLRPTRSAANA